MNELNEPLFQKDPYAKSCNTCVVSSEPLGVVLEQTVFFARSGGQQGDRGSLQGIATLQQHEGKNFRVHDSIYTREPSTSVKKIVHILEENPQQQATQQSHGLSVGDRVEARIDWQRRYAMMRLHTALHLLCSLVPHGVTGGNITPEKARLDFDCGGADLCRESLQEKLIRLVADDRAVVARWVDEKMLEQDPGLVRTLSVQPPRGTGRVRLIDIAECDLQPCGGTHVKSTTEIGDILIGKIENKGRHNRRISLRLADAA